MSFEIEQAKIELRLVEDVEVISVAELLRWFRARPVVGTPEVVAAVERGAMALGTARRLST